jgi:hypothetical protein
MQEYHKIQTLFTRNENNLKLINVGHWSTPEFNYLKNTEWELTEKVDGTNIRIIINESTLEYRGRTDKANLNKELVSKLDSLILPKIDQYREQFPNGVTLYGEGFGKNIQKVGKLYSEDFDFILFDARVGDFWLKRISLEKVAEEFELKIVPILLVVDHLKHAIEYVGKKPKSTLGDLYMEGVILKPAVDLFDRYGKRIVSKLKYRDLTGVDPN